MILAWILACVHEVSPELELTPAPTAAADPEPTTWPEWRAWVLKGDPLARHPRLPKTLLDPALQGWLDLATREEADPSGWWLLESNGGGTPAVAFARGARLAEAEVSLRSPGALLRWLVPLGEPGPATFEAPRPPLSFLSVTSDEGVLGVLERGVLLGWLDGPNIDVTAPAGLLADPAWARLAATPAGVMLRARGARSSGAAPAEVPPALTDATTLALEEAAADAPAEYTAVKARRLALGGPNPSADVVSDVLLGDFDRLASAAPDAEATGLALVAHAALRWRGRCPDPPCEGFDRLPELAAAARFGPGPARFVAIWRVIAWKGAVDELWAAWDRPQALHAMDRVVELLALDSPRALDLTTLLRPAPDSAWTLAVTRAAGGPEGTSKEALFRALYGRVAAETKAAIPAAPAEAAVLARIERRALKAAK